MGLGGFDVAGPRGVAADDVAHVGEPLLAEQAGSNRRPVATPAEHDGRALAVEFANSRPQLADGDGDRSVDRPGGDLAGVADVDELDVVDLSRR